MGSRLSVPSRMCLRSRQLVGLARRMPALSALRRHSPSSRCSSQSSWRKVFDMEACQRRLSSGYITLLFRVAAATDVGRQLVGNMGNMGLWQTLENMGRQVR